MERDKITIDKNIIESYLMLSEKDIAIRLGTAVLSNGDLYCTIPTKKEIAAALSLWIRDKYNKVKFAVCTNKESITGKRNTAVYAVVDLILSLKNIPAIVTLSVSIVDYGIDKFCAGEVDIFVNYLVNMLDDKI